ncbi:MAG: MATE family efflux transporter, partial [Ilumatobacteraceae bacterium]
VASAAGAGDLTGARRAARTAGWVAMVAGIIALPVVWAARGVIVSLLGGSGGSADHAATYLGISALGLPAVMLMLSSQGVFRGHADYRTPLWILLGSNGANAAIEWVLVFELDLSVAGSAWSTVVAQWGAAVALIWLQRRRYGSVFGSRPTASEAAPLLTAGRHLLLRVTGLIVVFTGSTSLMARRSEVDLAAHQIVMSLFLLLALILDALAIPAQTLVAESVGAGERPAARELTRRTERLSLVAGLALALGLVATSGLVPHLFTSDIAVVDNAREAVVILGIMLIPGAIAFAGDGVLIGLGDYRFIGRLSFATLLVVSPLYPVLALAGAGLGTLWLSLTGWMVLRAVSVHLRHRHLLDSRPVPQTR